MPQLEHILITPAVGTASSLGSKVETHTFSSAQVVVPSVLHVVIFLFIFLACLVVKAVGNRTELSF